ncbi:MAG TPA: GNAT family N-acetyltransferase [Acidocella sp.]|jgi:ribosomal protein S18 acetylase RimI-like enzyme|uniref:GNAT family N-acetyltransferase n=1 Tax=Acidocella sp. TaxID=50710 RepID=UPI002CA89EBE|nr:GNAT family N-acetyltransferase [Acidocella sp.]HVE21353.1 GNAT family N-acetyltransferase [Acidocella sp.]
MSNIRPALAEDLEAVQKLVNTAYAPYIPRLGRAPGPMNDDYAAAIARGFVYLIETDGALAGLVVLIAEPEALLLDNIAVAPAAQGQKIGRRLMEFAEETARQRGLVHLRLYTNELMTENIGWYTRLGFSETHRGTETGFRRVYMSRQLG